MSHGVKWYVLLRGKMLTYFWYLADHDMSSAWRNLRMTALSLARICLFILISAELNNFSTLYKIMPVFVFTWYTTWGHPIFATTDLGISWMICTQSCRMGPREPKSMKWFTLCVKGKCHSCRISKTSAIVRAEWDLICIYFKCWIDFINFITLAFKWLKGRLFKRQIHIE